MKLKHVFINFLIILAQCCKYIYAYEPIRRDTNFTPESTSTLGKIPRLSFRSYGNVSKCIDVGDLSITKSPSLQLYDCCKRNHDSQSFTLVSVNVSKSYFKILSSAGLCLEAKNDTNSTILQLNICSSDLNQVFLVKTVGSNARIILKPFETLRFNKCINTLGDSIQLSNCTDLTKEMYWVLSFATSTGIGIVPYPHSLYTYQWLFSPDGSFGLILQEDNNLVAYNSKNIPYYASGTDRDGIYSGRCYLNTTGDYVCANDQGKEHEFSIRTGIHVSDLSSYYLSLSNTGTLAIYDRDSLKYCFANCPFSGDLLTICALLVYWKLYTDTVICKRRIEIDYVLKIGFEVFDNYRYVSLIALQNSAILGNIPTYIAQLTQLHYFLVSGNQLYGSIPTEFGTLLSLNTIDLSDNFLNGEVPTEIGKLTNLGILKLQNNRLSGTINFLSHNELFKLPYLNLRNNRLSGTIQKELGLLTTMLYLNLESNQLSGTIPTELGNLRALVYLYLSDNQLIGHIPSELGQLKSLLVINLANNQLTGCIQSQQFYKLPAHDVAFCSMSPSVSLQSTLSPTHLHLSVDSEDKTIICEILLHWKLYSNESICKVRVHCDYNSSIIFDEQRYISTVSLVRRGITGSIHTKISRLRRMSYLDLSHNQLTGDIPTELGTLTMLQVVNLRNNSFTGCIPKQLASTRPVQYDSYLKDCVDVASLVNSQDYGSAGSSLSAGAMAGIIIFSILVLLAVLAFLSSKKKNNFKIEDAIPDTGKDSELQSVLGTSNLKLQSVLSNNNLESFNWDDFYIDATIPNIVIGEGSFGLVIRAKICPDCMDKAMIKDEDVVVKLLKNNDKSFLFEYDANMNNIMKEVQVHVDTERKIVNKNCISKIFGVVKGKLRNEFALALNIHSAVGIVMRYERGGSLSTFLYNGFGAESNLTLVSKVRIIHKIAICLAELHRAGVIHGDLKPDNILLSSVDISQAEIRLADFGFAELRRRDIVLGDSSLTSTTHPRGTPVYSSPEQLYNPAKLSLADAVTTYAKSSEKTDIYSFAILAWEILTQQRPFSYITSAVEVSLAVHQGIRPEIHKIPKDCPLAIRTMIERCWDKDRGNRLSALRCCVILRECYHLLTTMKYDVYLMYSSPSKYEIHIDYVRNRLIENGLKLAWVGYNEDDSTNQSSELIQQSKVILLCLDTFTQSDKICLLGLRNNRGSKRPRPVIPLYLECPNANETFPDTEIKVHCFMENLNTEVFDISSHTRGSIINDTCDYSRLDVELIRLVDNVHFRANRICII